VSNTGIKPRWEAWENTCIKKAFQEKIQLKIIALGLGRTLSSVNKKIRRLGLRGMRSIRGRMRGSGSQISLTEKLTLDREKMIRIIEDHGPLRISQKRKMALKEGFWSLTSSSFKNVGQKDCMGTLQKEKVSFSYLSPLDYVVAQDSMPKKKKRFKIYGNPCYVSLKYVEAWAYKEGFEQMGKDLNHYGLSYWKKGKYFSQTQLLIYVNSLRLEKKLQPLAIYEEDELIALRR
jgi:hypothetical protein